MTVTEAVERYYFLEGEGRPQEGLDVLLEASYQNSDPALDHQIALCYQERAWARCEDQSLVERPAAEPKSVWDDGTRSNQSALYDFEESLSWSERSETLAGKAFVLLGTDPDAADRVLQRALEIDPECYWAVVVMARLHIRRGAWAEAVEVAGRAVTSAPELPAAHHALAEALMGAGRMSEALETLGHAVSAMPYNVGLMVAWAGAFERAAEGSRAVDIWRRATEINRLNPDAWRGLALNAASRGDDHEMRRAAAEADRLDPDGTRAWLEREAASGPELLRTLK